MMTDYILQTIKRKYIIIIIITLLMACFMGGMKFLFSDSSQRHGDYLYVRTVQVINPDVTKDDKESFDYKGYLESPSNFFLFLNNIPKDKFDMNKIDSAWERKNTYEQMDWLKKKIQVSSYRANLFEVTVHLDANITHDTKYMKEHGPFLVDEFVNQSELAIKEINPNISFKTLNSEEALPIVEPFNRKSGLVNFAIIGALMGLIGSIMILTIIKYFKENKAR